MRNDIIGRIEANSMIVDLDSVMSKFKPNEDCFITIDNTIVNDDGTINILKRKLRKDSNDREIAAKVNDIFRQRGRYIGKLKLLTENNNTYYKNLILYNNFIYTMTDEAIENKKDVNIGNKKKNAKDENVLTQALVNGNYEFIREISFSGYIVMDKTSIDANEFTISDEDVRLMRERISHSRSDFLICGNKKTSSGIQEVYTFLSLINIIHSDKYDEDWRILSKRDFFKKLGFNYVEIDTRKYKDIYTNPCEKEDFFKRVSKKCFIDIKYDKTRLLDEKYKYFEQDMNRKLELHPCIAKSSKYEQSELVEKYACYLLNKHCGYNL